jgi:hypothetical protein
MGTSPIEGKGNVENGVARILCPRGQNEKRRAHSDKHMTTVGRADESSSGRVAPSSLCV